MGEIWQADFYRRLDDSQRWELRICDRTSCFTYRADCPQSQATVDWLIAQLQPLITQHQPSEIQVFRPQSLGPLEVAGKALQIPVTATRHTPQLKAWLKQEYVPLGIDPTALDRPPPMPLPENLWGEQWRFAALPARDLVEAFGDRPIPFFSLPEAWHPLSLGLASNLPIPGVVIDGGRQAFRLAQWLSEVSPAALNYSPGAPDGLILEAGLVDRWVLATFDDPAVTQSGQTYQQRQQAALGLHFLLVQPDDSGMTYSGFWLLRRE